MNLDLNGRADLDLLFVSASTDPAGARYRAIGHGWTSLSSDVNLKGAADFWIDGCRLQARRLEPKSQTQESLQTSRYDLAFYVVSVTRLQNVARRVVKQAGRRANAVSALLEAFDNRWPKFRDLRNLEEHLRGSIPGTSLVAYFLRQVADLRPDGSVRDLVDVEEMQPQVEDLYQAIVKELHP